MGKRTAVIYNPISGRGKGEKLGAALADGLSKIGHKAEICRTDAAGDARRMAAEFAAEGFEILVAVGGDGTISEITGGLNGADIPIAVCPTGTANVLALELGIPSSPEKVVEVIRRGRTRRIDIGKAGEKLFIVGLSAGVDAWVVRDLHNARKGAISMATYTTPIVRAIRSYRFPPITVEIDGEKIGSGFGYVVVGNTHRYGGPLRIARRGKVDDGLFDVTVARGRSLPSAVKYAAASLARALPLVSGVKTYTGRHVKLIPEDDSEVPVQIDGDPGGRLPVAADIIPGAQEILVP